jgi:alkylhydroperoxidase family enzyme
MSWVDAASTRDELLGMLPAYRDRFDPLYRTLWRLPQIPAPVLELCRLRLAQLHGSVSEWQREEVPLSAGQRDQLRNWPQASEFSEAERACLEFAEIYTMDPGEISDAHADAVKAHYGDDGLVALVEALGLFFGLTRLSLLWQLEPDSGTD